ncbi:MAG: C40 family peptidase [Betaproteobacteria bacterium]
MFVRPPHRFRPLAVACTVFALAWSPAQAKDAPAPRTLTSTAFETVGKVWNGAQDVAIYALGLIGVDYRFGGNTPASGLDCSGLVRYVFQEVTGVSLPRTSREMSGLGSKIAVGELKAGDLVFFNTRSFQFSHVGIYLGDNRFIHAPARGGAVEIARLSETYWQKHFDGARRLVGVLPALMPTIISPALAEAPAISATPLDVSTATR